MNELSFFFTAQGDASEALEFVEEALDEMALFVEHPVDRTAFTPGWITLDMGHRTQLIGDEAAQVVGIIGCIHDDVLRPCQPFDQATRLWTVTPLTRRDRKPDGKPERVDGSVDLCGKAAFGSTDTGSLKPPF